MFQAYFDESGTHGDSPIVTVAGFLASDRQWARFQSEWNKTLQHAGISFFHMAAYENRQKPFTGQEWEKDERIRNLKKFLSIIKRRITIPVVAAVGVKDYKEAELWRRYPHDAPKNPYAFCALMCLQIIAEWADKVKHDEPIAYIFENGAPHKGEILKLANYISKNPGRKDRYRWVSLNFTDKRDFNPLQAADILAYESYKEAVRIHTERSQQQRKSFVALFTGKSDHPEYRRYFRKSDLSSDMPYFQGRL